MVEQVLALYDAFVTAAKSGSELRQGWQRMTNGYVSANVEIALKILHVLFCWTHAQADRKRGLGNNDLDIAFVRSLVAHGCSYCGTTVLRISLDRIDNLKAHNKSNVVACCFRCNYIRNSMPYEAWLILAPAVRAAYEKGLFADWRVKPFNKK